MDTQNIKATKMPKHRPRNLNELQELVGDLSVNLSEIDTSRITNMSALFKDTKRVDFSGIEFWDTSKVVDMMFMFENALLTFHAFRG